MQVGATAPLTGAATATRVGSLLSRSCTKSSLQGLGSLAGAVLLALAPAHAAAVCEANAGSLVQHTASCMQDPAEPPRRRADTEVAAGRSAGGNDDTLGRGRDYETTGAG